MSVKNLNAVIQLRIDTEANWQKTRGIVPAKGEMVVYAADDTHECARLKVGDGYTDIKELAFIAANKITQDIAINTAEEWNKQLDFVPEKGQIIIYSNKNEDGVPGIKIGDGNAYCVDLPFVGDDLLDLITAHIEDTDIHVTTEEKNFWNNKLNLTVDGETLSFNRE